MVRSVRHRKSRSRFGQVAVILAVVILVLLFRLVEDIGHEQKPGDRFVIVRVIDGDTVELAGGDRLRLLGIDTPERGELYYDEARFFLEELTLNKKAKIEYANTRRDQYGRLLGFVYVQDTIFTNERILKNGLGCLYLVSDQELDNPLFRELLFAQREAVENKMGLWSVKQDYEDYYITGQTSLRFHRPGCRSISNMKSEPRIFDTKQEALYGGLSPCRICRP